MLGFGHGRRWTRRGHALLWKTAVTRTARRNREGPGRRAARSPAHGAERSIPSRGKGPSGRQRPPHWARARTGGRPAVRELAKILEKEPSGGPPSQSRLEDKRPKPGSASGPRRGRGPGSFLGRVPTHTAALRLDSDGGRRAHCLAGPDPAQIPGGRHRNGVQALGTGHRAVIRERRHLQRRTLEKEPSGGPPSLFRLTDQRPEQGSAFGSRRGRVQGRFWKGHRLTAALRPDSDGGRRANRPAGPDPAQNLGGRHKDGVQALGTGHHAVIREGRHIQSSDSDGGQRPQSQERAGARLDPTGRAARAIGGRSTESTTRRTRPVSSVSGDQHRPRRWPGVTGLFGHVH